MGPEFTPKGDAIGNLIGHAQAVPLFTRAGPAGADLPRPPPGTYPASARDMRLPTFVLMGVLGLATACGSGDASSAGGSGGSGSGGSATGGVSGGGGGGGLIGSGGATASGGAIGSGGSTPTGGAIGSGGAAGGAIGTGGAKVGSGGVAGGAGQPAGTGGGTGGQAGTKGSGGGAGAMAGTGGGGGSGGSPISPCPATPPLPGVSCAAGMKCYYEDCAGAGRTIASCDSTAHPTPQWTVTSAACGTVHCSTPSTQTCASGEICVVTAGGAVSAMCVKNTCGAGSISCGCVQSCFGDCIVTGSTEQGVSIYCSSCPLQTCA